MADSMADTLDDLEVQAIDSSSDESTSATDIITDVSTTVTVAEFSSCSTSSGVVDLLNTLKVPRASSLSRKRVLSRRNPRKSLARGAADPVTITPAQRAREEEIGLKRSVIQNHVKSLKHKRGQERLRVKEARERDLADALKRHDQQISQAGDTLPEAQRIFRVKVAMTFLRAGVPFEKVFYFRELLEESAYRLVDKRHLLDIIPFILKEEKAQIKKEIEDKFVSVIFDGTSRLGEVLVVLLRYVHQMKIEQRLVRVELLAKSLKGEEVARELISILSVTLGIKTGLFIAAMRDRASVNNVAVCTLSIVYPSLLDVGCIAHTLDHVGEKFQTTVLNNFVTQWISLFSHSPKYRLLWKTQTGISMKSYSKTRWWSRWEVMEQMLTHFNDIPLFLGNEEVTSVTANKLSEVLVDTSKRGLLKLELAAVIDLGSHFVKATYN
uniref:DUF4371 domain-containing protein n=1 Tax=Amphimedon queenslandica TaxID=400682 RepID=A0A1X7U381_AMPQE